MTDTFVSIDGGKSELRLLVAAGEHRQVGVGPGMVYQQGEDGVDRIVDCVRHAAATVDLPARVSGVVAGLTGIPGDSGLRRQLTRRLEEFLRGPALVIDDVYPAHAGVTLVAIPGELFLELGESIRAAAGSNVVVLGYTNGYLGYLPTRSTPPTYETLVSPVRVGSGEQVVDAAVHAVTQVRSER